MLRHGIRRSKLLFVSRTFSHELCTDSTRYAKERRSSAKLPERPIRTRFAPSPTGHLHIGSLRTALFNLLAAKVTGGQFVLRIEDTDQKRLVPGAETRIFEDLKWAGLQWDEGPDIGGRYGPYRQSERKNIYQEKAQELIRVGKAYRCFCSAERLLDLAKAQYAQGYHADYDRACLHLSAEAIAKHTEDGLPFVVRLKAAKSPAAFNDLTYGVVKTALPAKSVAQASISASFEDPILLKSDGHPTYHLANVVDDKLMEITHVIRAAEWMSSTSKHIQLYEAFGWKPPVFCHVGLVQDAGGQKLSKRLGSDTVASLRDAGIFPQALTNYCALLGWSHKFEDDFMTLDRLQHEFDLLFTRGDAVFDMQKLVYLQSRHAVHYAQEKGRHLQEMINAVSQAAVEQLAEDPGRIRTDDEVPKLVESLISTSAKHYVSPVDFFERYRDVFSERERNSWALGAEECQLLSGVEAFEVNLDQVVNEEWCSQSIQKVLKTTIDDLWAARRDTENSLIQERQLKRVCFQYLRWALAGGRPGLPVSELLAHLGKSISLQRLQGAREQLTPLP